jgi:hypothetical protein
MNYLGRVPTRWGGPLAGTPFYFLGPRPYREAELAAHIRREHARGRRLTEILGDPYIDRRGGQAVLRTVLERPSLIRALGHDVVEAIRRPQGELMRSIVQGPGSPPRR